MPEIVPECHDNWCSNMGVASSCNFAGNSPCAEQCREHPCGQAYGQLPRRGEAHRQPPTSEAVDVSKGLAFVRARLFADVGEGARRSLGDFFRTGDIIGGGSTGSVYVGRRHFGTRPVAIKTIPLQAPLYAKRKAFEAESVMLARLEHPNIARMFFSCCEKEHLAVVLEFCRGGELFKRVASSGHGLGEAMSRLLFRQMLAVVGYLHGRLVVHRDIKPENLLLLDDEGEAGGHSIKICDFGMAVQLSDRCCRCMGKAGTLSYTAPEVYRNIGGSFPADIWSLGVVLFMMLTAADPFRHHGKEKPKEVVQNICLAHVATQTGAWHGLSDEAHSFVMLFFVVEEQHRPTCTLALEHVWMDSIVVNQLQTDPLLRFVRPPSSREPEIAKRLLQLLERFAGLEMLQRMLLTFCARFADDTLLFQNQATAVAAGSLPWYDVFVALDCDHDGRLSHEELAVGLGAGLLREADGVRATPHDKLAMLARALDVDQSGAVEWTEWSALSMLENSSVDDESLVAAFQALDAPTGDGEIRPDDLVQLFSPVGHCEQCVECAARMLHPWAPQVLPGTSNHPDILVTDEVPGLDLASVRYCVLRALQSFGPQAPALPQAGVLCKGVCSHSIPPLAIGDGDVCVDLSRTDESTIEAYDRV